MLGKYVNSERRGVLGCNAATSREHIQSDTFSEENMSGFASDSRDMLDWLESLSFLHVPFYSANIPFAVNSQLSLGS